MAMWFNLITTLRMFHAFPHNGWQVGKDKAHLIVFLVSSLGFLPGFSVFSDHLPWPPVVAFLLVSSTNLCDPQNWLWTLGIHASVSFMCSSNVTHIARLSLICSRHTQSTLNRISVHLSLQCSNTQPDSSGVCCHLSEIISPYLLFH